MLKSEIQARLEECRKIQDGYSVSARINELENMLRDKEEEERNFVFPDHGYVD